MANRLTTKMDWTLLESMEPQMLVGVVNTTLRNENISLEELCRWHDLDPEQIKARLGAGGFTYRPELKQFR